MHSIHAIRWIENLKDTDAELYWFDVLGRGKLETIESVCQFTDWRKRKVIQIKGEYFLSKKYPKVYEKIIPFLEVTENEALEKIILEIQPDVVHSFEMQSCSYPILKTMNKFPKLKWIYSCWGNDLYYYKNIQNHKTKITSILKRVNYLHTDCERDFKLAVALGFKGKFLGVIPGGTGYKIDELISYKTPINERKIILVKGYQNLFGRGLNSIKALEEIQIDAKDFSIVIFGAHRGIVEYVYKNQLPYKVYHRHELTQDQLLAVMGKALVYIGNSISDGMPNTLLEAIVMGAFPIQSNPGGVTEEIIHHGENGFLIENPECINEIRDLILKAITNQVLMEKAFEINIDIAKKRLDYDANKIQVRRIYANIMRCE